MLAWVGTLHGQSTVDLPPARYSPVFPKLTVDSIQIEGNRHTRKQILLRELPFQVGDTCQLHQLVVWFDEAKRALMNTTLFQQVIVYADSFLGGRVRVVVRVRERFNIYPALFFEPVDRNLNQWLVEQRASLRRVNYGAQLFLNNTTGRGDRTQFTLLGGYAEQILFSYERPYFDRKLRWGFRTGFSVGRNKEVNAETRSDKQVFLRDPDVFLRHQWEAYGELRYRPRINTRHSFGFQWRSERIADTVRRRNPDYFPGGGLRVDFPRFYYMMNYQRVDHLPYPRKGLLAQFQLSRSGLGSSMNLWELHAKGMMHWPLGSKWGLSWGGYAGIKFPSDQAFFNRRMLGYGNQFLSGYEYYVVDGLSGALTRLFLTRELVRHTLRIPYKKEKDPAAVPVRLMARSFLQAGYVHDPEVATGGRLANSPMYSGGFGIDLLLFYDLLFRFEYSINRFGENGLFLHRKYPF